MSPPHEHSTTGWWLKGVALVAAAALNVVLIGDGIRVLTADAVEEQLITRPYFVGDLIDGPFGVDEWRRLIPEVSSSEMWDDVGGPGSIRAVPQLHHLLVRQTSEVHREIAAFVAALRDDSAGPYHVFPGPTEAERRLERILEQKTSLRLHEVPLCEAAARISRAYGVAVELDPSVRDTGLQDYPVTVDVRNVSLAAALDAMLEPLGLECLVSNDALVFLVQDPCESEQLRIYWVADLAEGPDELDALANLIRQFAEPEMWDPVGGPGTVTPFPPRNCLLIVQTPSVHESVVDLLAKLRAVTGPIARRPMETR